MKFKLLFLAFVTTFTPAALAMDAPLVQDHECIQTNSINADDVCSVCHTLAENIPQNERCITNCCKNFICAQDAHAILYSAQNNRHEKDRILYRLRDTGLTLTDEQLKKMYKIAKTSQPPSKKKGCPFCSRNKLSVSHAFLKKPLIPKKAVTIKDSEGKEFQLTSELSTAFLQCESFQMHEDKLNTPSTLDFSDVKPNQKRFLKKNSIIKLAHLIKDPIKELKNIPQDLDFFELANYTLAPRNILYLIANELWPLMQDQGNDTSDAKVYKKYIRQLAKPHFASPKHLAEHRKTHTFNYQYFLLNNKNLSTNGIQLKNNGWYQDEKNQWYKVYPYCTLDGIGDLYGKTLELKVNNQRLTTLTGDEFKNIHKGPEYPTTINLDNNPITHIDESFFQELAKKRAEGIEIDISLQNSHLTSAQKEEYQKKFNTATHTLPQRYLSHFKFKSLAIGGSFIGTTLAIDYLSHKNPELLNTTSKVALAGAGTFIGTIVPTSKLAGVFYGGIGTLIGWAIGSMWEKANSPECVTTPTYVIGACLAIYASSELANHVAFALAKRSHPDIKPGKWPIDEYVWKNNYKIKL